jgi:hypothetical protein
MDVDFDYSNLSHEEISFDANQLGYIFMNYE